MSDDSTSRVDVRDPDSLLNTMDAQELALLDINLGRSARHPSHYWKSGKRAWLPEEMPTTYLRNALDYAVRVGMQRPVVAAMYAELKKRNDGKRRRKGNKARQ